MRLISIKVLLLAGCSILEAKKPNIMVIFADDVGTGDVPGYYGHNAFIDMPNLESLIRNGTTFTDAHSTPLCAPSRYVLLSGNYQHRGESTTGTWEINHVGNQFRYGQKSIAEVLRDNGYNTAMFGKWHLGGKIPIKDGFTPRNVFTNLESLITNKNYDWTKPIEQGPWDIGFQKSYITLSGIQKPPYVFFRDGIMENTEGSIHNLKFWSKGSHRMPHGNSVIPIEGEGSKEWDSTAYNMILVNETEKFLNEHVQNTPNQPFFTYVALGSVHIPHSPPDRYIDGSEIAGKHATKHLDLLSELDKVVGSLIEKLDEKKLTEDTIIVFTSDNGGLGTEQQGRNIGHFSNGRLRDFKGSIYEGGHRVPLTIRWDNGNIPRGEKRSSRFVGLNDIYATLCEFAGVTVPPGNQAVDSMSFAKYALDENNRSGLRQVLGTWTYAPYSTSLQSESIRFGTKKLIHHFKTDTYELYDLSNDLSETNNLISSANFAFINRMYEKLKQIGPCYDNPEKFWIEKLKENHSCCFFRKSTILRCKRYPESWVNCGRTCSRNCKYVSERNKQKREKLWNYDL